MLGVQSSTAARYFAVDGMSVLVGIYPGKIRFPVTAHVKETKLSLLAAFVPILGRRYEEYKRRVDNDSFSKIKEVNQAHYGEKSLTIDRKFTYFF